MTRLASFGAVVVVASLLGAVMVVVVVQVTWQNGVTVVAVIDVV